MMTRDYLEKVKQPGQEVNPLFNLLGVAVEKMEPDSCVLSLPFQQGFIQGAGLLAGGIMATLADEAMAHLVLSNLEPGSDTATIEMNMRFLRPLDQGPLKAEARMVKKGKKIITVKAEVKGPGEKLLAEAGASFMVIE